MWLDIVKHFQTLEQRPVERMIILVGGLLFFWIIEGAIPLLKLPYKKTKTRHAAVNFGFTVIHLIIHTLLAILIVLIADWCQFHSFGLVHWLNAGVGLTILIAILSIDFSSWLVHWVMHKVQTFVAFSSDSSY